MKALKYFGILLVFLILVFLSIGIFSGKQKYQVKTIVQRPVHDVFQLFNDHAKISEWLPEIKSFETIIETADIVGSKYKMTIENQGKRVELFETVTQFKENEMIEMEFMIGWMHKFNHFTFIESPNGTQIVGDYIVEGNNIVAKSMFSFFTKMFTEIDSSNLDNFRIFAEKQIIKIEPTTDSTLIN